MLLTFLNVSWFAMYHKNTRRFFSGSMGSDPPGHAITSVKVIWRHFLLSSRRTFAGARFADRSTGLLDSKPKKMSASSTINNSSYSSVLMTFSIFGVSRVNLSRSCLTLRAHREFCISGQNSSTTRKRSVVFWIHITPLWNWWRSTKCFLNTQCMRYCDFIHNFLCFKMKITNPTSKHEHTFLMHIEWPHIRF